MGRGGGAGKTVGGGGALGGCGVGDDEIGGYEFFKRKCYDKN